MNSNKSGDGPKSPENTKKPLNPDKTRRLAEALRANLRKRKSQAAARGKPGQDA